MNKALRIWNIIVPIGIYYVISGIVYYLLEGFVTSGEESYMLRQTISSAATVPFIWRYFTEDTGRLKKTGRYGNTLTRAELVKNGILAVVTMALLGIAVNDILAMTPLVDLSDGFTKANQSFFGGKMIFELLGSCLVIPVAEELLYRGVVYRRIKALLMNEEIAKEDIVSVAIVPAILISAVIFGLMHANVVQFLYAAVLGVFQAFLYEKTNCIYLCMLGHIAANFIAVLRENTGILKFAYEPTAAGIGFTVFVSALVMGLILYLVTDYQHTRER